MDRVQVATELVRLSKRLCVTAKQNWEPVKGNPKKERLWNSKRREWEYRDKPTDDTKRDLGGHPVKQDTKHINKDKLQRYKKEIKDKTKDVVKKDTAGKLPLPDENDSFEKSVSKWTKAIKEMPVEMSDKEGYYSDLKNLRDAIKKQKENGVNGKSLLRDIKNNLSNAPWEDHVVEHLDILVHSGKPGENDKKIEQFADKLYNALGAKRQPSKKSSVASELLKIARILESTRIIKADNEAAYKKLLQKVTSGTPILTAGEIHDDIPTIHTFAKKYHSSVKHLGYGMFRGETPNGQFTFDAGGAMNRDGDISWTTLDADKNVLRDLGYNMSKVKKALKELLSEE